MLNAPTSEAKADTAGGKTPVTAKPEQKFHPHMFGAAGPQMLVSAMPNSSSHAQHRQTIAGLQTSYGNQAVLRMLRSPQQIARKPAIRPSQSMMLQRKCACGGSSESEGECAECKAKSEGTLWRSASNQRTSPAANAALPITHDVLSSPEHPSGDDTSTFMESSSTAGTIQTKLAINKPGDQYEREADWIADQVSATSAHPIVSGIPLKIQRYAGQATGQANAVPDSVDRVLASSGRPLEPAIQQDMGQRFDYDFSHVRVHTGTAAEQSARDVSAHAYTVGSSIVFDAGRFAPQTHEGRRLLAHELTHVVQQSGPDSTRVDQSNKEHGQSLDIGAVGSNRFPANELLRVQLLTGQTVVAREPNDDADVQVSLGYLDNAYVGKAAEELLGHSHWLVLREFLRGIWAGLQSAPPEQRQRIDKKFEDFGVTNAFKYVGGYALGIGEGLWASLKGLIEAVITLIKLPYDIDVFLREKVPVLAVRYGPRIAQLLTEGGGLPERINRVIEGFLEDPAKSISQISSFLDAVGNMALAQVRALGHSVASKTLGLLEEPWFDYGRDIGKVVGQILFEVILAVASDTIANVVKEALTVAGRISAQLVTDVVELIQSAGRLLGEAVDWVARQASRAVGELGEMFEGLRAFLTKLRALFAELGEEGALADTGVGGARVPIPEAKPPVLEARMVKPPVRTSPATVADLQPPKVHPSNVPKEVPAPEGTLADEAGGVNKRREPFADDPDFHKSIKELEDVPGAERVEGPADQAYDHPTLPEDRPEGGLFNRTAQEFDEIEATRERGNTFNTESEGAHQHNEVDIESPFEEGKRYRLDSYDEGEGIISRKYPKGAKVNSERLVEDIVELADNYPRGARIADTPKNRLAGLAGKVLDGQPFLDVPVLLNEVPQEALDLAERVGVLIRDTEGNIYR